MLLNLKSVSVIWINAMQMGICVCNWKNHVNLRFCLWYYSFHGKLRQTPQGRKNIHRGNGFLPFSKGSITKCVDGAKRKKTSCWSCASGFFDLFCFVFVALVGSERRKTICYFARDYLIHISFVSCCIFFLGKIVADYVFCILFLSRSIFVELIYIAR